MLRRLLPVLLALVLGACSQGVPGEIDETRRLEVGDEGRSYELVVPANVLRPAPLVVVFHGWAGTPREVRALSGFEDLARREGIAVAFPSAAGLIPTWRSDAALSAPDIVFIRDLVDDVASVIALDERRVYAAGLSNGGGMAGRLACDASDVFAAVGVVAAAHGSGPCQQDRPVPVIAFHGDADRIVPIDGIPPLVLDPIAWLGARAMGNGCDGATVTRAVADDVERTRYEGCDADIVLYEVAGGRHGWPGSQRAGRSGDSTLSIDATRLMWEFFADRPIR